jgi:hypothetical protein
MHPMAPASLESSRFLGIRPDAGWLNRACKVLWPQDLGELLFRKELLFNDEIADASSGAQGLLRNLRRVGIANVWIKCGHHTDRTIHVFFESIAVGRDAANATFLENETTVAKVFQTFEDAVSSDGQESIQLQLSCFSSEAHGDVVADHFECNLIHYLGNNRINFAGHNAGSGLHGRQINLAKTSPRT